MSRNVKLGVSGVSLAILVAGCNLIAGLDEPTYDPSLDNPGSNLDGSVVGDDDGSVADDGSVITEGGISDTGADGAKPGDTVLTVIAGKSGGAGYADGPAANARFNFPRGAVWDGDKSLYIADTNNDAIRVYHLDTKTVTTLLIGRDVVPAPWGLALIGQTLYVSANQRGANGALQGSLLLSINVSSNPASVRTLVGSLTTPVLGALDGNAATALLSYPKGISVAEIGKKPLVLIADSNNAAIRAYDPSNSMVSTIVNAKAFADVSSVAYSAAQNRYEATSGNAIVGYGPTDAVPSVSILSGGAAAGTGGGLPAAAQFRQPDGLVVGSDGVTIVADTGNNRIQSIFWGAILAKGSVTTIAGDTNGSAGSADNATATKARFDQPGAIANGPNGGAFVVDSQNHTIRQISVDKNRTNPAVSTLAGRAPSVGSVDGALGTSVLAQPVGVAYDSVVKRTFATSEGPSEFTLRVCSEANSITTIANGGTGTGGTGAIRTTALAYDSAAKIVYAAISNAGAYTKISTFSDVPGNVATTYAGGTYGYLDGSLLGSKFAHIYAIALDPPRKLMYVTDRDNGLVRKIDMQAGTVSTFAGKQYGQQVLDGPVGSAEFVGPTGIAVDSAGNVYVAQSEDENSRRQGQVIRKIDKDGTTVTTIAGTTTKASPINGLAGSKDGTGAEATFFNPGALAFDGGHYLYVADNGNHAIRRIDLADGANYAVTTVMGAPSRGAVIEGPAISAGVNSIFGLTFKGPNSLVMADRAENVLLELSGLKP